MVASPLCVTTFSVVVNSTTHHQEEEEEEEEEEEVKEEEEEERIDLSLFIYLFFRGDSGEKRTN